MSQAKKRRRLQVSPLLMEMIDMKNLKISIIVFLFVAFAAKAQDIKYARPVNISDPERVFTVYTFDNDDEILWFEGSSLPKPRGEITDTLYCLLVKNEYLLTVKKDNGDMLYNGKVLPFDNAKIGDTPVSKKAERKPVDSLLYLEASLVCERTEYRFNDSLSKLPGNERYIDSVIGFHDTTYLIVRGDVVFPYSLIVKDTDHLKERFNVNDTVRIDISLFDCYGLPLIDTTIRENGRFPLEWPIHVVPEYPEKRPCLSSFINDIELVVKVDKTAEPPIVKQGIPLWIWLVLGGVVLLALAFVLVRKYLLRKKPDDPQTTIEELQKELAGLKEENATLTEQYSGLNETNRGLQEEKDALQGVVDKMKDNPRQFKDKEGYDALSKIIAMADKADRQKQELETHPDLFGESTPTGKMVEQGRLLKKLMEDALSAKDNELLAGSDLQRVLGYIEAPETILGDHRKALGLYKLIESIKQLHGDPQNPIASETMSYDWLKDKLEGVIGDCNRWLTIKEVAATYGSELFDVRDVPEEVAKVFEGAKQFQELENYRNYWKNIVDPLSRMLEKLWKNENTDNTRALMFYASQFYSIACIMSDLYGSPQPVTRAKLNVRVFNGLEEPMITDLGLPKMDEEDLNKCRFEYRGGEEEGTKLQYLSQFMPMPFIFIQSYYPDDILNPYKDQQ